MNRQKDVRILVDISGTVVGESLDCLLLSGTAVSVILSEWKCRWPDPLALSECCRAAFKASFSSRWIYRLNGWMVNGWKVTRTQNECRD